MIYYFPDDFRKLEFKKKKKKAIESEPLEIALGY